MLSVWLPLNGDLHNQGLSNITAINNGATVDNNGKIGKCYSFDGNDDFINLGNIGSYFDGSAFSICFWIYSLENKTRAAVFSSYGLSSTSNFFGLELNSSSNNYCNNNLRFDWLGSDTYSPDDFVTYDAWTHICVTYDGVNQIKMYKNGALIQTSTRVLNAIPVGNTYYLGRDSRTGSTAFNGKLNDFRIYDHCLSPRECKQVSTALVLHYPLAMPGQENIIANTSHEIVCTYPASGTKDYYFVKTKSVPNETQYTLSFEARSTVDGDHLRTHFYSPNTTTTCESSQGIIKTASDGNMDFTLTTEWRRYWVVYTQTETTAIKSVICPRLCSPASYPSSQSGTGTVYVRNQKLEHGSHPTPWIPNPTDAEYSALGFNDGIEYDVSGYGHNSTKVGAVVASADTPRYSTSSSFDGSSYIINNTSTIHLSNEFTIAWWGKVNSWQKKWEGMFLLQNTPALQSGNNVDRILSCLHGSTQGVMDLAIRQAGGNAGFDHYSWPYIIGEWAYYACTYKAGVVRMYKDGSQTYTATIQDNSSNDYYFTIGRRNNNCDCQMSDFRIYTTALSADDILELYHTPITLANNGVLMTQGEFEES